MLSNKRDNPGGWLLRDVMVESRSTNSLGGSGSRSELYLYRYPNRFQITVFGSHDKSNSCEDVSPTHTRRPFAEEYSLDGWFTTNPSPMRYSTWSSRLFVTLIWRLRTRPLTILSRGRMPRPAQLRPTLFGHLDASDSALSLAIKGRSGPTTSRWDECTT